MIIRTLKYQKKKLVKGVQRWASKPVGCGLCGGVRNAVAKVVTPKRRDP
jgi:hypothetical protein